LSGQGLKINVVCGRSAGEENTAAKPTEKAKNNIICCTTPINPPAQRITRVTATEGHITRSGRYVTPVHPPPQNFGVISIEGSATETVNIKMESQKKLKVDLVAEKDLQAKAMEQFLMWKG